MAAERRGSARVVDMTSICQVRLDAGWKRFLISPLFLRGLSLNVPGSAPRRGQYRRRLILLISVDGVPPYCDPSRACLPLGTRVDRSRLFTSSRTTRKPWPPPTPTRDLVVIPLRGHGDQFVEVRLARADRADVHGGIGTLPLRMDDGDRIFMDVETDEKRRRIRHG